MQPPVISPDHHRGEIDEVGTITALLQERKESSRMEGNCKKVIYLFKGIFTFFFNTMSASLLMID